LTNKENLAVVSKKIAKALDITGKTYKLNIVMASSIYFFLCPCAMQGLFFIVSHKNFRHRSILAGSLPQGWDGPQPISNLKCEIPRPQIRNTQSNNLGVLGNKKYRLENRHYEEACPEPVEGPRHLFQKTPLPHS